VAEIADAGVFGGIHFRTAYVRGNVLGRAVVDYMSSHVMRELDGERDGKISYLARGYIRRPTKRFVRAAAPLLLWPKSLLPPSFRNRHQPTSVAVEACPQN